MSPLDVCTLFVKTKIINLYSSQMDAICVQDGGSIIQALAAAVIRVVKIRVKILFIIVCEVKNYC